MTKKEYIDALVALDIELTGEETLKDLETLYASAMAGSETLNGVGDEATVGETKAEEGKKEATVDAVKTESKPEPVKESSSKPNSFPMTVGDCKFERPYVQLSSKAKRMYEALINDEIVDGFYIQSLHGKKTSVYRRIILNSLVVLVPQDVMFALPKMLRAHLIECFNLNKAAENSQAALRAGTHAKANESGYSHIF